VADFVRRTRHLRHPGSSYRSTFLNDDDGHGRRALGMAEAHSTIRRSAPTRTGRSIVRAAADSKAPRLASSQVREPLKAYSDAEAECLRADPGLRRSLLLAPDLGFIVGTRWLPAAVYGCPADCAPCCSPDTMLGCSISTLRPTPPSGFAAVPRSPPPTATTCARRKRPELHGGRALLRVPRPGVASLACPLNAAALTRLIGYRHHAP